MSVLRLAFTADLHYGMSAGGNDAVKQLASRIAEHEPDVLAIGGDVAAARNEALEECLSLFRDVAPVRVVVPGNHDVWILDRNGHDSFARWETVFPAIAETCGFSCLDRSPVMVKNMAIVGCMGWYDYSLASDRLEWSDEEYARKEIPGKAVWNDVKYVRWDYSDHEFTELQVQRLRQHLAEVRDRVRSIVAITHHVPFRELISDGNGHARFVDAYLGAMSLGEALLSEPKVCLSLSGHVHRPGSASIQHIRAVNVGSGYRSKRFSLLEVPA